MPLVWKTLKGKKGHVKGEFQKELLEQLYRQLGHYRRVIVPSASLRTGLGDAEFSNEPVIQALKTKNLY